MGLIKVVCHWKLTWLKHIYDGLATRPLDSRSNSGGVGFDNKLSLAQDNGPTSPSIQPTFILRNTGSQRGMVEQRKKLVWRNGASVPRRTSVDNQRNGNGGRREQKRGAAIIRSWSRGAVFGAKAEPSARSVSIRRSSSKELPRSTATLGLNGRLSSVDKELQEETEAIIHMGKALGICFDGKDNEVIKKLKDMEVKDKERALPRAAEAQVGDNMQS
ncbi:hypothetical protein LOK49_LG09G02306 [Camellia lanceoleosa]|uniref:Uncharacterized protein n=1 Tax=Camellia lanceoleosa TaxID=1840588 RepID=A0ACC0GHH9_9ERIC|nr:hypothetical protein LOK49_LG09G02306 [Camellia lanceoleosa]